MPQRLQLLENWLQQTLGFTDYQIQPASSDASFRRYFRVTPKDVRSVNIALPEDFQDASFVVMDAPPFQEDVRPFIQIATMMSALDINVPRVLAQDSDNGFLLLTDLGSVQYQEVLTRETAQTLYQDALDTLFRLQKGCVSCEQLPPYDEPLLARELEIFREWYLQKHLGLRLRDDQNRMLDETFVVLIQSALEQPRVCVHRDFHSRNLMQTSNNNPGVLDFQDAVCGPLTYDLVSLLRYCYISWPDDQVKQWAIAYLQRAHESGIFFETDHNLWLRWFDFMGMQRHLKAVGIFARLDQRDGKNGYLKDIPRTLAYVAQVSQSYSVFQPFYEFLLGLDPALARQ